MTYFDRRTLLRAGLVAGAGVAGGALLGAPGAPAAPGLRRGGRWPGRTVTTPADGAPVIDPLPADGPGHGLRGDPVVGGHRWGRIDR